MTELTSISFDEIHEVTKEFRELLYDMPFQVPQNVIFLGAVWASCQACARGWIHNLISGSIWRHTLAS